MRRVRCRHCGKVKRERLEFLADNPLYTKRFAFYVGRRCRSSPIRDVAKELKLDWHTVKELDKQYMRAQLAKAGTPAQLVIGIDEISVRKGHTYRIVVSDLIRERPIWFGGDDRSEASMSQFYQWLGSNKSGRIRLAVMDMWKPFETPRPPVPRRQRSCSTSSISFATSAKPSIRFARASMRAVGKEPSLHQGTEIHAAVAQGESDVAGPTGFADIAAGQSRSACHAGEALRWRGPTGKKIGDAWGITGKAYVDRTTAALRYYGLLEYQGVSKERE